MNLLARINLAVGAASLAAAALAAYAFWAVLQTNARHEMLAEAGLMMDSATAIRSYTAGEILPLLGLPMRDSFPPQSIPFYAATQNFLKLRERHPQYMYKEATLNPTNPRDRAADWEADIIQRFRNDARMDQAVGERDTPMGRSLYLARPIRMSGECLQCHGSATAAPANLLARYGADNGFGWQDGEIVGAQVVSVPFASATANAERAFRAFAVAIAAVLALSFLALNGVLYLGLVRPLRRIAQSAERVSTGERSAAPFPTHGALEIVSLARSFDRLRISLDKALRLLER